MAAADPLVPGDPSRLGAYVLSGRLGEGGQGTVYLATAPGGRDVAVKLLRVQTAEDTAMRERFVRELAVLRRVAGFCTARVLDADVTGDRPYIVSEYIPGPSLQRQVTTHGPLAGTDLERLAVGTATALTAIHRAGIAHRDFKPPNVLMGPDGPRVIDFGIARVLGGATAIASGVVGTPAYMAPEQVEGARIDKPVDVFAWAATIVFAATGRPPFGDDSIPAVMNRVLHRDPDLGALPPPLRAIIAECFAKNPSDRPGSQDLLLRLLDGDSGTARAAAADPTPALREGVSRAAATRPTLVAPPPPMVPGHPPAPYGRRRRSAPLIVAAVLVALLGTGGAVGWLTLRDRDGPAMPAYAAAPVKVAASSLAAITSYDYRTFDADADRARALETGALRQQYDRSVAQVRRLAKEEKAVVRTTTVASGLENAAPDRATVLVFANQSTFKEGQNSTTRPIRVRLGMVRRGGNWLADRLDTPGPGVAAADASQARWPEAEATKLFGSARACVTALHSLNAANPDDGLAAIDRCVTGEFAEQTRRSRGPVRQALRQSGASSTVRATEVALVDARGSSQATVLVSVDAGTHSSKGDSTTASRYRLEMSRVDGRWLISNLKLYRS